MPRRTAGRPPSAPTRSEISLNHKTATFSIQRREFSENPGWGGPLAPGDRESPQKLKPKRPRRRLTAAETAALLIPDPCSRPLPAAGFSNCCAAAPPGTGQRKSSQNFGRSRRAARANHHHPRAAATTPANTSPAVFQPGRVRDYSHPITGTRDRQVLDRREARGDLRPAPPAAAARFHAGQPGRRNLSPCPPTPATTPPATTSAGIEMRRSRPAKQRQCRRISPGAPAAGKKRIRSPDGGRT